MAAAMVLPCAAREKVTRLPDGSRRSPTALLWLLIHSPTTEPPSLMPRPKVPCESSGSNAGRVEGSVVSAGVAQKAAPNALRVAEGPGYDPSIVDSAGLRVGSSRHVHRNEAATQAANKSVIVSLPADCT